MLTCFFGAEGKNELDAARVGVQNRQGMTFTHSFHQFCGRFTAVLAVGTAMFLSSCGEKEADSATDAAESTPTQVAEAAAPAPVAEEPAVSAEEQLAAARTALFDHAVYALAQKVTSPDAYPELNSVVKDMLELMQTYYNELQKGEPGAERARLAVLIATTTRDLGAYSKAQVAYETAKTELEALPEDVRNTPEFQRLLSSCCNGVGVCLLAQGKANEALAQYEAALAVDEAQYGAVAPAEGEELPEGDVEPALSRAVADLLDSYRCLGDCQRAVDDPEEARTTYTKGHELVQRIKRLSPDMSVSYVKLLTSLGNLDNELGKSKEALNSWVIAAKICQSVNASCPRLEIKAETKRCFEALVPVINSVGSKLQMEQQEAEEAAANEKAAAEKAAAEQAAAEKEAAERLAAEQAAAETKAAEEAKAKAAQEAANKRARNRNRR